MGLMRTRPTYLTADERQRFLTAMDSPRDHALFAFIYHDGLRVDEAAPLTIADINLRKGHRLPIRRLKNGNRGERSLWRHTCRGKTKG
jgi:integrase